MAKLTTTTISKRTVEALAVGKDTVFWDSELSGFGVRVSIPRAASTTSCRPARGARPRSG